MPEVYQKTHMQLPVQMVNAKTTLKHLNLSAWLN